MYLNDKPRGSGRVWDGFGGVAMLATVCHWRLVLTFQNPHQSQSLSLTAVFGSGHKDLSYCSSVMPMLLAMMIMD